MKCQIVNSNAGRGFASVRRGVAIAVVVVCAVRAAAAPMSSDEAITRARMWMQGHPVMGVAAERAIQAVTAFPADTPPECVYVVELSQGGYLVLTSDDRLAPVVAFDAVSTVNLADRPDNAFRAFLSRYVANIPASLQVLPANAAYHVQSFSTLDATKYGPYTETGWTQWHPYNLYCPAGGSMSGYQGRVPVGCTPVAWAQVMGYHRWPLYGQGTHSYTDSSGSIRGAHSVDFSESINWDNMLNTYSSSVSPYQQGQEDIGALMYKLGVAAGIDYEGDGSAASIYTLGARIRDQLFFENFSYSSSANTAFYTAMKNDLRAGYPCVVGIPGHAVIVDGLLDDASENYHINYGWAGNNDGWWTAGGVPGGAIQYGITGIRPRLMAIPRAAALTVASGEPVTLEWVLPRRRGQDVSAIRIQRKNPSSSAWETFASDTTLNVHRATRTSTLLDGFTNLTTFFQSEAPGNGTWLITSMDDVPTCAYLDVSSTSGFNVRMLRSITAIRPDANSVLAIRWKRYLASPMQVEISTSSTGPWTQITSFNGRASWQTESIPLADWAGQTVYLRFNPIRGSAYSDGGIWIDSVSLQNVTNVEYEKQPIHYTELSTSLSGVHTLRAVVVDLQGVAHEPGPEFTLTVGDGTLPDTRVQITGFEAIGNGRFVLTWSLAPTLQGASVEVMGSMVLPPLRGWQKEIPISTTPTSATLAPVSNCFFHVRVQ